MKLHATFLVTFATVGLALTAAMQTRAQGTFNRTILFDGPPYILPGNGVLVTYYYEDSMTFTPINPDEQFSRAGGGREAFPEDGSAYILQGAFNTLAGSRGGISRFGLYSVDLSEFSILYDYPRTIQFVGYRADGDVVTIEFKTDGIIDGTGPLADFQTFYFDKGFNDLVRFELPSNTFALDNLVFFDVVPEPGVGSLLLLGAAIFARRFFQTKCLRPGRS